MTQYMVNSFCVKAVPGSIKLCLVKGPKSRGACSWTPPSLPHVLHTDTHTCPPPRKSIFCPSKKLNETLYIYGPVACMQVKLDMCSQHYCNTASCNSVTDMHKERKVWVLYHTSSMHLHVMFVCMMNFTRSSPALLL